MGYRATLNEEGKRTRGDVSEGDTFVYVGTRNDWFSVKIVEETASGEPIEIGTRATVTHVFDFDYPFQLTLDDGRTVRTGNIHRRWNRADGPGVGDIVKMVDGERPGELGYIVGVDESGVATIHRYKRHLSESWFVYCHANEYETQ